MNLEEQFKDLIRGAEINNKDVIMTADKARKMSVGSLLFDINEAIADIILMENGKVHKIEHDCNKYTDDEMEMALIVLRHRGFGTVSSGKFLKISWL